MPGQDQVLSAMLEAWTINDGNYPEISVGMHVNLAFEMGSLCLDARSVANGWVHLGDARYRFGGTIRQRYDEPEPLVVVTAGSLTFFSEGHALSGFREGETIAGEGTLVVDYYAWTENAGERRDPTDIFYNLVVERIRELQMPHVTLRGKSVPHRIGPGIEVLETNAHQHSTALYLVDFRVVEQAVPRTFLS